MKNYLRKKQTKFVSLLLLITIFSLCFLAYLPLTANAISSYDNQWEYTLDSNNEITITKYKADASSLTIPSYIDGRKVISIGVNAFIRIDPITYRSVPNTTLQTVQISEGIKSIQTGAFGNCTSLVSVVTPSTLESIGDTAFFKCLSLSSINLGNNLKTIGERAFFGTALTSLFIPSNITTMGLNPFTSCSKLTTLTVDPGNQNYTSVDNVLFNKGKDILLIYPNGKSGSTYTIPDEVTQIGGNAFYQNQYLSTVSFSKNLRSIGINAFGNSQITSVSFPDSLTEILNGAFAKCCSLTSVVLSKNLQKIDVWSFYGCPIITLDFPYTLKSIGEGAFQDSFSLTTARFYGAQPTIGTDVFLHASANFSLQYNQEYASSWSGYNGTPFSVAPLGVAFKSLKTTLALGSQQKLQVSLSPSWIPGQSLIWNSDNDMIVSVDKDGWVTPKTTGTTTIHVLTANGKTAQCEINVILPITSEDKNWTYQINTDNTASILSYKGLSQVVTIPNILDGKIVTTINDRAFKNSSLTNISLPASLINIGNDSLTALTLQSIEVDSNNLAYTSQNGILYSKDFNSLIQYPIGRLGNNFSSIDRTFIAAPEAPTKPGYNFYGWYKEAECINPWNFAVDKVTTDTVLYIKWADMYDTDKDGIVGILDLATVAANYNKEATSQNWNPNFDFNKDGIIDIFDLVQISKRL